MINPKYLALGGMAMYLALAESGSTFGKPQSSGREYEPSKAPKKVIPKGCKEYDIDGITVIAISEKSAIRKVQRIINRS